MSEINTDVAKNLDLIIRKDNDVKIIITALDGSGTAFDFTGATVSILLFRSKDQNPFITKVSDTDTDYISISSNIITVNLIDDLTSLSPAKYYWALRYTDSAGLVKDFFVNTYRIIVGASEEDITDTDLTVAITLSTVTVSLTVQFGMSQTFRKSENLIGTKNGSNNTFTLPRSYLADLEFIIFNGRILESGVAYTRSGLTITMLSGYIPLSTTSLKSMGVTSV